MTIAISAAKAVSIEYAGETNNPFLAWDNLADDATVSTTAGTEGQSADYAFTGTTYDRWTATPNGSDVVELEAAFGSATSIGFGAITAHNLADVGASVRVQYSTDGGSSWADSGAGVVTPSDNQAIAWWFTAKTAQDWRLRIFNATGDVQAGVFFLGNTITIPRRIYSGYRPPITPTQVELMSNVSEGGELLGTSVTRRGSTATAPIKHVSPTFLRASSWTSFQDHYNAGGGFFWGWRPEKYGDVHYAWRSGGTLAPSNMGVKDLMEFQLDMRFHDEP